MIIPDKDGLPTVRPLTGLGPDATIADALDAARYEIETSDDLAHLRDQLDRKSRGEPVIVTGTAEQMADLERTMRLGHGEREKRRARRREQRASRRRNR